MDEVEIVIIATGFNNNQNGLGMEPQGAVLRQVSMLSKKLDYSYNSREGAEAPTQTPAQPTQPTYAQPSQPLPYAQPYGNPQQGYGAQPAPAQYGQPSYSFEPDDPIPEQPIVQEPVDRKHRPRFVDFFMRKNGENQ